MDQNGLKWIQNKTFGKKYIDMFAEKWVKWKGFEIFNLSVIM